MPKAGESDAALFFGFCFRRGFSAFRNFVQMAQITEEDLVEDPDCRGGILLAQEQWARVSGINRYMLLDEGEAGQLEMGLLKDSPPDDPDGYLKLNLDEKWVTVENKSVAFYQTADAVESDSGALIPGYIPVRLNGREARLTAQFDLNSGGGTITGISLMNGNQKEAIQRDVAFELKKGDVIEFYGKFRDKEGQEFDRTLWFYTAPSDLNEWTVEYKTQEDSRWRIIYEFVLNTGGAIQSQPFIPREREEPAVQAAA